ncbi:hypothetical protein A0H81_11757 [Grifola frondosa]|uniref:Transglycosylase SLT domain-containing protein n=1 Tax=Grifola frondosa TaxID=5627 RepID=A0A1C7LVZ4_GRIFR|nr:hypothetical protein A0H81_11757 [Grifola frondosa]
MKLSTPFFLLFVTIGVVEASKAHDGLSRLSPAHRRHSNAHLHVRSQSGRCKTRAATSSSLTSKAAQSSTSISEVHSSTSQHSSEQATTTHHAATTSHASSASHATSSAKSNSTPSGQTLAVASGVINVASNCGAIGASKDISPTSGPNGAQYWLNCGVDGGGWNPPYVKVSDIVAKDLNDALKESNSPFTACAPYVDLFYKYGNQFGVAPILIASIAMQESSCNPDTTGGAGEQGLMQITKDKCGAAPGGNCKDPDYNIKTGTDFFKTTLNDNRHDSGPGYCCSLDFVLSLPTKSGLFAAGS